MQSKHTELRECYRNVYEKISNGWCKWTAGIKNLNEETGHYNMCSYEQADYCDLYGAIKLTVSDEKLRHCLYDLLLYKTQFKDIFELNDSFNDVDEVLNHIHKSWKYVDKIFLTSSLFSCTL